MATTPQKAPFLSIIILNYHTDEMTFCLVKKMDSEDETEVILVDNSSSRKLENKVKELIHTKYINPGSNLGFAGGVNRGINESAGEWIMLLNSDADTDIQTIKTLIEKCKTHNMKVATAKLITNEGKQETNVGYFSRFLENPINWLFLRPLFISPTDEIKVQLVTGGALLLHRSVFEKVGLFDDKNFFMYFEDIDYSFRLHQAGISILYVPSCVIKHVGGGSSNNDPTQKDHNYFISLNNYLLKHRGPFIVWLNSLFHFLE